MQSVHYRQKLNFTFPSLEAAGAALRRIDDFRFRLEHAREAAAGGPALAALTTAFEERFDAALADDLNVSGALGALFEWIREVNSAIDREALGAGDRERLLAALARADEVFGVFDASRWPERAEAGPAEAEVEELVAAREAARRGRDWAEADRLRDQLAALGVVVEDTPNGPRWKRR